MALLLALVPWTGRAQDQPNSPQTSVPASSAHIIDGAVSPEQIPDQVIFRIWAAHNTRNGKVTDLDSYGLSPAGVTTLTAILKEFRAAHDSFVANQDDRDDQVFWRPLLAQTAASFNRLGELSPKDLATFKAHLQVRKSGLKLSDIDYGLDQAVRERNLESRSMVASGHFHPGMMPQSQGGMTANYNSYSQWTASGGEQIDVFGKLGALSSNWVNHIGAFSVDANGYVYQSAGGGFAAQEAWAYYKSSSTFADSCTSTRAATIDANHISVSPAVRISPTAETGYYANFYQNLVILGDAVNGTYQTIQTAAYTSAAGDVLTLCAIGSNISVSVNGHNYISVANTAITAPGYDGMWSNFNVTGRGKAWRGHTSIAYHLSGEVSGNTSCSGGVCPIGAFHYGTVTLNGVPVQGPRVLPNNYLDATNDTTIYDFFGDNQVGLDIRVNCTIIGLFYHGVIWPGGPPFFGRPEAEIAQTTAANIGPVTGEPGNWYVANHCYPSPPDMDVDYGKQKGEPVADPAWDDEGECNRVQVFGVYTAWGCPIPGVPAIVFALPVYTYVTTPALQICTIWSQGLISPNGPGYPLHGTPPN